MNSVPKPAKTKSIFIYLVIIIFFLLLACAAWMFFESRIKDTESKKEYSSITEIKNTNKTIELLLMPIR
jgi:flagellar basal body-associated protein FliL